MATDYLGGGLDAFWLYKVSEADGGYDYYGRLHRNGDVLIQRSEIATKIMTYFYGDVDFDTAWTNKASLTYKRIDQI